jgi:hypothetical protein
MRINFSGYGVLGGTAEQTDKTSLTGMTRHFLAKLLPGQARALQ